MFGKATLFWLGLAAAAGGTLFKTSYEVQELQERLTAVNRDIVQEQEAIKVLKAEWSYLNDPSRLEATMLRHALPLQPTTGEQIAAMGQIPLRTTPLARSAPATSVTSVALAQATPAPASLTQASLTQATPAQATPATARQPRPSQPLPQPPAIADAEAEEAAMAAVPSEVLEEARAATAPVTTPAATPAPTRKPNKPKVQANRAEDAIGMLLVKLGAGQP